MTSEAKKFTMSYVIGVGTVVAGVAMAATLFGPEN